MRKILLSVVCLMVIGIQSMNAQLLTAALHHNGKVTIYGSDQLSTAMNDAVAGDSLFLSGGSYPQKLTITRAISVIGTGATGAITEIRGGIEIAIPDTLSHVGCQLRDIKTTDFTISKPVDSLRVTKCHFNGTTSYSASTTNTLIDRCLFNGYEFQLSNNMKKVEIIASKIAARVTYSTENASDVIFTNCNIKSLHNYTGYGLATYINCIINFYFTGVHCPTNAQFVNCLCGASTPYTQSIYQNCWTNTTLSFDGDMNAIVTSGSLPDYIGTDGTVVGSTGSANPYTLVPNTPHVTDAKLDVDSKTKKLIVTMSVE